MRLLKTLAIAAAGAVALTNMPAAARHHDDNRYDHNDNRHYNNRHYHDRRYAYDDCRDDKRRAGNRGTAIGAGVGGLGTAALGGGLGESLLGAGVGAVAGHAIGRGGHHC